MPCPNLPRGEARRCEVSRRRSGCWFRSSPRWQPLPYSSGGASSSFRSSAQTAFESRALFAGGDRASLQSPSGERSRALMDLFAAARSAAGPATRPSAANRVHNACAGPDIGAAADENASRAMRLCTAARSPLGNLSTAHRCRAPAHKPHSACVARLLLRLTRRFFW
jgi:hypothetical protein